MSEIDLEENKTLLRRIMIRLQFQKDAMKNIGKPAEEEITRCLTEEDYESLYNLYKSGLYSPEVLIRSIMYNLYLLDSIDMNRFNQAVGPIIDHCAMGVLKEVTTELNNDTYSIPFQIRIYYLKKYYSRASIEDCVAYIEDETSKYNDVIHVCFWRIIKLVDGSEVRWRYIKEYISKYPEIGESIYCLTRALKRISANEKNELFIYIAEMIRDDILKFNGKLPRIYTEAFSSYGITAFDYVETKMINGITYSINMNKQMKMCAKIFRDIVRTDSGNKKEYFEKLINNYKINPGLRYYLVIKVCGELNDKEYAEMLLDQFEDIGLPNGERIQQVVNRIRTSNNGAIIHTGEQLYNEIMKSYPDEFENHLVLIIAKLGPVDPIVKDKVFTDLLEKYTNIMDDPQHRISRFISFYIDRKSRTGNRQDHVINKMLDFFRNNKQMETRNDYLSLMELKIIDVFVKNQIKNDAILSYLNQFHFDVYTKL